METFNNSQDFAQSLDTTDPVAQYRSRFFIPNHHGKEAIYLCGNSLGLQPKSVAEYVSQELSTWRDLGVEGHFDGTRPWMHYHKNFQGLYGDLIGAKDTEVVVMNNLTVNIHLLMVSFYQPTKKRFKILMEGHAFPSDQYAVDSQVTWHGFAPSEAVVELFPREGEHTLRTEDIIAKINELGDELALTFFSGVQYYTGQFFDMASITQAAHSVGAMAGFDLAHAVGNVPMRLHDWQVDFATWCSYKYLNSGPGGVSGIYINERHATDVSLHRFVGWWGHDEATRFKMGRTFHPTPTAEGWQLSNAPVLSMAAHLASMHIFKEVGMNALREKSLKLTGFLEFMLKGIESDAFQIITPSDTTQRGCQMSLLFDDKGRDVFRYLSENGVIADWREPNVIRVAPVPLYNTFIDVYNFGSLIKQALDRK